MTNPYAPPTNNSHLGKSTSRYLFAAVVMTALSAYVLSLRFSFRFGPWSAPIDTFFFWLRVYTLLASVFAAVIEMRKSTSWQEFLPWVLVPCILTASLILYTIAFDFFTVVITVSMLLPYILGVLFALIVWRYSYLAWNRARLRRIGIANE